MPGLGGRLRGSNRGLAGHGMEHKIETGWGIREIVRAGYGMKMSWRDRDERISIGGMRDSFDRGTRPDSNSKWALENSRKWDRDKDSESDADDGMKQKMVAECGI